MSPTDLYPESSLTHSVDADKHRKVYFSKRIIFDNIDLTVDLDFTVQVRFENEVDGSCVILPISRFKSTLCQK